MITYVKDDHGFLQEAIPIWIEMHVALHEKDLNLFETRSDYADYLVGRVLGTVVPYIQDQIREDIHAWTAERRS